MKSSQTMDCPKCDATGMVYSWYDGISLLSKCTQCFGDGRVTLCCKKSVRSCKCEPIVNSET